MNFPVTSSSLFYSLPGQVSDLLREGRVVGQNREGRYSAVRATDRVGHRYVLDGHHSLALIHFGICL